MTFVTGSDHSVGFPLMMRTRAPLFVLDPRLRARCASHTAPRLPNRIPLRAPGWPRMTVAVIAVTPAATPLMLAARALPMMTGSPVAASLPVSAMIFVPPMAFASTVINIVAGPGIVITVVPAIITSVIGIVIARSIIAAANGYATIAIAVVISITSA